MSQLRGKAPLLDFSDVLIAPKPGNINSRKDVNLVVTYGNEEWIPIIASNMDTVGTFATARILSKFKMLTCLHKFYTVKDFKKEKYDPRYISVSCGISDEDLAQVSKILEYDPNIDKITVDVANGYTEKFRMFLRKIRDLYPYHTIFAGNVCDYFPDLFELPIDGIKLGIGSGCFPPGTIIITNCGKKNIEDIVVGDRVLTHNNEYKEVTHTHMFHDKDELIEINKQLKCTPNHEFYVIPKVYKDIVTDENIHEYARWVAAEDLDESVLLIQSNS